MCVASASGSALLTIYVDITARKATEAALRRSEAMLSHLFATSPDVMTLSDLETGRFVLVNQRFSDVFGWVRAEAIGRTALGVTFIILMGSIDLSMEGTISTTAVPPRGGSGLGQWACA